MWSRTAEGWVGTRPEGILKHCDSGLRGATLSPFWATVPAGRKLSYWVEISIGQGAIPTRGLRHIHRKSAYRRPRVTWHGREQISASWSVATARRGGKGARVSCGGRLSAGQQGAGLLESRRARYRTVFQGRSSDPGSQCGKTT